MLHALHEVLRSICAGDTTFIDGDEDPNPGTQARIDAALEEASAQETPWFAPEMIYGVAKVEIDSLANLIAEKTIYLDGLERAVCLNDPSVMEDTNETSVSTMPRGIGTA